MLKKFLIMVTLLATTAFTMVLGEDFNTWFLDPNSTAVIVETTAIPTETEEPTATEVFTNTPEFTTTPEPTSTPLPTLTQTIAPTNTPTETQTKAPTYTPTKTITKTPTKTLTKVPTIEAVTELFKVQEGSPVFMPNFSHPSEGCAWQGIAGQVFSSDGKPLLNYVVKITGKYNGVSINMIGLTGLVTNTPYGPGSYEFILGNKAVTSTRSLKIQLFSPKGVELTEPMLIQTSSSCSKNLQILNFIEN